MDNQTPKPMWGPWSTELRDPAEQFAQLRCLRTLIHVLVGDRRSDYSDSVKHLERALQAAEDHIRLHGFWFADENMALADARALFDALPAARQRDIIATFAVLHKPVAPPKEE